MDKDVRGISFPFRLGNKGGIVMSEANLQDSEHIEESIEQILCTCLGERVMNYEFGSELDTDIFKAQDSSLYSLLRYQIMDALRKHEPRINVDEQNITILQEKSVIQVEIKYTLVDFPNFGLLCPLINLGGADFESKG